MTYQVEVFHRHGDEVIQDAKVSCIGTREVSFSGDPIVVENLKRGIVWKGRNYTSAHGIRFLEAISLALSQNPYLSATDVVEIS